MSDYYEQYMNPNRVHDEIVRQELRNQTRLLEEIQALLVDRLPVKGGGAGPLLSFRDKDGDTWVQVPAGGYRLTRDVSVPDDDPGRPINTVRALWGPLHDDLGREV